MLRLKILVPWDNTSLGQGAIWAEVGPYGPLPMRCRETRIRSLIDSGFETVVTHSRETISIAGYLMRTRAFPGLVVEVWLQDATGQWVASPLTEDGQLPMVPPYKHRSHCLLDANFYYAYSSPRRPDGPGTRERANKEEVAT